MKHQQLHLIKIIRYWLVFFMISLIVSGVTALDVPHGIIWLCKFHYNDVIDEWLHVVSLAIATTNQQYPFLFYGYDWLAFAHIVIAVAFIGPYQDPVRNKWVIQFGRIACIMIIPFALIAGGIRGIPFWWQLIDCSFGIIALWPLSKCYSLINKLEKSYSSIDRVTTRKETAALPPFYNHFLTTHFLIIIAHPLMKIKMILPALTEAKSPYWRPVKYSLFPPLGLATLAAYCSADDEVILQDEHVEELVLDDVPDMVVIQVYITNAFRSYQLATHYKKKGAYICLGGLHVTSLPEEAMPFADTIFLGPGEESWPRFLKDFKNKNAQKKYVSMERTLISIPPIRRDLIKRKLYLVPNSIVVSRGCPHHCSFCYKDAFFEGGRSFYTQQVDEALAEIDRLPGRHLYFLDDHLLGNQRFSTSLFEGMKGMNRVFQGASTIDAILRGDLIEKAAEAGMRSVFVGFETLSHNNLAQSNKKQNMGRDYDEAIKRLHSLGIMINGSFVFGLDEDDKDVFKRTVDWAVSRGITTSTFHILTPYPGTALYKQMESENRLLHRNWDQYDTRQVVYKTKSLSPKELLDGYNWAYKNFYSWSNVVKASLQHDDLKHCIKHFAYAGGWKKFEPLWNFIIKTRGLNKMLPLLESILSKVKNKKELERLQPFPAIA